MDLNNVKDAATDFVGTNSTAIAIGAGAAIVGGAVLGAAVLGSKSKKTGKRIKHTSRGWRQDRKRKSKQKWEVAYRKRKSKRNSISKKRNSIHRSGKIKYTKNGQPYKIMADGKARFIKKTKGRKK